MPDRCERIGERVVDHGLVLPDERLDLACRRQTHDLHAFAVTTQTIRSLRAEPVQQQDFARLRGELPQRRRPRLRRRREAVAFGQHAAADRIGKFECALDPPWSTSAST